MKEMRFDYSIPRMCHVFKAAASGYYAWLKRPRSKRAQEEERLQVEIKAAHKRTRGTYGSERLKTDLAEHGVKVGVHRIKRIRKVLGIRCKQKKKFKATTDSTHTLPVADNLLDRKFTVSEPRQAWVSDITYIATDEGWLYCAAHKDLFNGEIVGYALGARMTRGLVSQSLFRAVAGHHPPQGLIHHSDRGSQYCSSEYQKLLTQFGMKASMSRRGNCYDNAPMESFWGTLKNELIYHYRYRTREEAIKAITEYIEVFYNRQRRQARLGYLSPVAYLRRYYVGRAAA